MGSQSVWQNVFGRVQRRLRRPRSFWKVFLIVGFVAGVAFVASLGSTPAVPPQGPERAVQTQQLLDQFSTAFEKAAGRVNPSVVPIFAEQTQDVGNPFASQNDPFRQFFGDDFFQRFFGAPQGEMRQKVRSLGSGVIMSADGYILTNNHVVDGADKLWVTLENKKRYSAEIIGRDPQTDVAVIKIDAHNLPVAAMGNSDSVHVGQWVIAVGNPFQLMHTVTAGIISARGRSSMNLADYEDFIQTDASINPGNSGGALADLEGRVVGINTAILNPNGAGGNVGIGFAIPINMARGIMETLVADGKVTRGFLGLLPQDVDEDLQKALGLPATSGALVGDVTADGPAAKAGVERGDVILKVDDQKVENSTALRKLIAEAKPGSKTHLTVLRDGSERTLTVTLGKRPDLASASDQRSGPSHAEGSTHAGMKVQELRPDLAQRLGYEGDSGILVVEVTPGGPAEEAGIRSGDLIELADQKQVESVSDFQHVLKNHKAGDTIAILVRRKENTFFTALQVS